MATASAGAASSSISLHSRRPNVRATGIPGRIGIMCPRTVPFLGRRRIKIVALGESRSSRGQRRVYRETQQVVETSPLAAAKEIASTLAPAGAFVVVTFVLWKLVEKILIPKPSSPTAAVEKKAAGDQSKWSFAAGANMLSGLTVQLDRQAKQKLNDFSKELRSFSTVDLSGHNFGDEGLFFLAESLAYNQVAEQVSFAANGITADGLKAFDGVLQTNIGLKTLNLSGNLIGDEGAKCLCDILSSNNTLQKLQLNSTNIGDEGAKAIADMLKKNSTLRVVELNNNLIEYSGVASIAGSLPENKTIQSIHLNGNYGGPLAASALAKGLEGNKSIRELHLHGNSIGDEGIRALMSGFNLHKGKITNLDISNNSITSKGAFYVAEFVKKSKSLKWLNLYMNDIGDEGAEKMAEALKENRSLAVIDLGGNNIRAHGITAIAQVFKDNSVITSLGVAYNPIGPEGAQALCEVLKFHGQIQTLELGWCQIGPKGAEYVADMLKYNTTISTLDLRANGLKDDGTKCLARSLKVVNEALTTLNLGYNEIRDDGAFAIAQALKANEDVTVTSINFANNFLTKFGQSALTDAKDHVFEMTEKELNIFL
ncbi:hypothetical protein QQ045_001709 [Rhodiola kirilowii]